MNKEAKGITGEDCFKLLDQYAVGDMATEDISRILKLIEKDGPETIYGDLLEVIGTHITNDEGEVPEVDPEVERRFGFTAGDLLDSIETQRYIESHADMWNEGAWVEEVGDFE